MATRMGPPEIAGRGRARLDGRPCLVAARDLRELQRMTTISHDLLIRAGVIDSMASDRAVYRGDGGAEDPMTCAIAVLPEMLPKFNMWMERPFPTSMVCWGKREPCKAILLHNTRVNGRALGGRFILALVGSGEAR